MEMGSDSIFRIDPIGLV